MQPENINCQGNDGHNQNQPDHRQKGKADNGHGQRSGNQNHSQGKFGYFLGYTGRQFHGILLI
jgi:hypothetical protein